MQYLPYAVSLALVLLYLVVKFNKSIPHSIVALSYPAFTVTGKVDTSVWSKVFSMSIAGTITPVIRHSTASAVITLALHLKSTVDPIGASLFVGRGPMISEPKVANRSTERRSLSKPAYQQ